MAEETKAGSVAMAPATVQALRELVVRISRGEAEVSLGSKALKVLASLVERPEEVAVSSIMSLAASVGVNASTLSRLARSLGYDSFAQFQQVFRNALTRGQQRFYSEQGQRLLDDDVHAADGPLAVVAQLAQESIRNIDGCLAQLEAGDLTAAAALLARAHRVRVFGARQMHAVASFLSYGLGLIRPEVGLLDGPGQSIAASLAHLGRGDVLLLSGVSPYSRQAVVVARAASAAGIKVIAITDSRASPLTACADHAFFIPHASSFISNSIGAYVVFCEGLINLVAKALGSKALKSLERQEEFIAKLDIEMR
ncbi:MurR/RpiR family transcriptional regulator [Parazoarcus communis]|nr:MurR/RpiR family transcriptional regulator [Parazoarcus communis]